MSRRSHGRNFYADRCADENPERADAFVRGERSGHRDAGVIAALQDLGFIIERANEPLGLVTAARFAEPNYYDVLGVTVTVRAQEAGKTMIRANAIYNSKPIDDPKVYQNFLRRWSGHCFW